MRSCAPCRCGFFQRNQVKGRRAQLCCSVPRVPPARCFESSSRASTERWLEHRAPPPAPALPRTGDRQAPRSGRRRAQQGAASQRGLPGEATQGGGAGRSPPTSGTSTGAPHAPAAACSPLTGSASLRAPLALSSAAPAAARRAPSTARRAPWPERCAPPAPPAGCSARVLRPRAAPRRSSRAASRTRAARVRARAGGRRRLA